MHKYKTEFIEFMISSGVLTFGDFVTKSGRRTPYFINTGNYRTGAQLSRLGKHYAECIMRSIGGEFDVLFGPAYKGVPIAVATAAALYSDFGLDREYCFNRKEVKDHGEKGILVAQSSATATASSMSRMLSPPAHPYGKPCPCLNRRQMSL
jgi:orotate phosphoribosyltransferase